VDHPDLNRSSADLPGSSRALRRAIGLAAVTWGVARWAIVTVLLLLRPLLVVALMPLGALFVLLSVIGGFAAEVRGLVDHRWMLLAIGLVMIGLVRIYDGSARSAQGLGGEYRGHGGRARAPGPPTALLDPDASRGPAAAHRSGRGPAGRGRVRPAPFPDLCDPATGDRRRGV
jgi:hypothetical protein